MLWGQTIRISTENSHKVKKIMESDKYHKDAR